MLVAGCAPGVPVRPISVPPDGRVQVSGELTVIEVDIPPMLRRHAFEPKKGFVVFRNELAPLHTVVATAEIYRAADQLVAQKAVAGKGDEQVLAMYVEATEPLEREIAGRPGNLLRSYEHVGGTRPRLQSEGVACDERRLVAEDRGVPGQGGKPFLLHNRLYTCIAPQSHLPVTLSWSERYPVGSAELSDGFEQGADTYFDSLTFQ